MTQPTSSDEPFPLEQALALVDRLEAAAQACRDADVACARVLLEVADRRVLDSLGCASVGELGERVGLSADAARRMLDLGRALRAAPTLEAQVHSGRIPVASAAAIGVIFADPSLQRGEDDWLGWAESESTKSLRRRIRKRIEDARCGADITVPVSLFVRPDARDDFDRARQIASRKASRALTPGETFEAVVDHYLDTFDEDRVKPGQRRCPPTAMVEGRYVPMAVRREIYERQGRLCAVPLCDNAMFLERAHLWAHASGGDREADNLILLCSVHHALFDGGWLRVEGTAARPRFFDRSGQDLGSRYDAQGPASGADPPRSPEARPSAGWSPELPAPTRDPPENQPKPP